MNARRRRCLYTDSDAEVNVARSGEHRMTETPTRTRAAVTPFDSGRLRSVASTASVLSATVGLAAVSWVVAVREMDGMDMGVATGLGSFAFFAAVWVLMMAA